MNKSTRIVKKLLALFLVVLMSIESFAAVVGDNDGAAFITKAEFDSLKNDFQTQINRYNTSLDNKINGAIAAYLSGIKVAKTTIIAPSVTNYSAMRFYHDFKIWGRKYTLNTSKVKSMSDQGWWDLQLPKSSRTSRGGLVAFVSTSKNAGSTSVGTGTFTGILRYSNPKNTDWAGTDLGNRGVVPKETFKLIKKDGVWFVDGMWNDTWNTNYYRISFLPKYGNMNIGERCYGFYLTNSSSAERKFNLQFNSDTSNVLNVSLSGWQAYGGTLQEWSWDIVRPAKDIIEGMDQFYGMNTTYTSENVGADAYYGASTAMTITRNLVATIPTDWDRTNCMWKYGSFPQSNQQFMAWKYSDEGYTDYSDVTEYNEADCYIQQASIVYAPLTDWGYGTDSYPYATSATQPSGKFYLPIAPIYKLIDFGSGTFKTKSGNYLKYCDGLVLFENLNNSGTVEIKFKLIGYNSKDDTANTTQNAKIYIANNSLISTTTSTPNYLTGTINNGTSDVHKDKRINGLSIDYNKTYTITIPDYMIQDKTDGDKFYMQLVPSDNNTFCCIQGNTLDMKLISN